MTHGYLQFVITCFGRNAILHARLWKQLRTFLKQPGERFQRQLNQQERFRNEIISSA